MSQEVRQRRTQANYLNTGTSEKPDIMLLGVGAKTLDESPSAQTKSKKYVCDKSTTRSISGYDWSTSFELDQIRAQGAINYIVNIGEKQLIGADAETEYYVVDLDQKNEDGTYHARKFDVAIEVSSFSNDDGEMTCTGNFLGKGDPIEGKFDTSKKEFTPDEEE